MQENYCCEFEQLQIIEPPGGHWRGQYEPHHIGRIRHDRIELVLSLCHNCHRYGHERDRKFLIWCMFAKMKKGELNIQVMNELTRGRQMVYLVESIRGEVRDTDQKTYMMAEEILEGIRRGEL